MKRHVLISLEFIRKMASSFHHVMSDTDKQRYFLIFMRSWLLRI